MRVPSYEKVRKPGDSSFAAFGGDETGQAVAADDLGDLQVEESGSMERASFGQSVLGRAGAR